MGTLAPVKSAARFATTVKLHLTSKGMTASFGRFGATKTGTAESISTGKGIMTIAVVSLENGYILVGKSASADPDNFNAELGQKFAREDAMRQMWPLEGYALRERLHQGPAS